MNNNKDAVNPQQEIKPVDLTKVTLNLPSEGQKAPLTESKPLFGNVQLSGFQSQSMKKDEKAPLFKGLASSGQPLFGNLIGQTNAEQKSSLFQQPSQQQANLFAPK